MAGRVGRAAVAAAVLVVLAGCPAPTERIDYSYELQIIVTGSAGTTGTTVNVVDPETAGDIIAPVSEPATPIEVSLNGTIDYSAVSTVRVSVVAGQLPDSDSFRVQIIYTETAYPNPIDYTIADGTATNATGGLADITYRSTFVLPYHPGR